VIILDKKQNIPLEFSRGVAVAPSHGESFIFYMYVIIIFKQKQQIIRH